jgi:hypothetical protein
MFNLRKRRSTIFVLVVSILRLSTILYLIFEIFRLWYFFFFHFIIGNALFHNNNAIILKIIHLRDIEVDICIILVLLMRVDEAIINVQPKYNLSSTLRFSILLQVIH